MTVRCEPKSLKLEIGGATRNLYHCRIPVTHTLQDVLHPDYFGQLQASDKLTVGDRVYCEWADFSCMFELLVLAQSPSVSQLICRPTTDILRFDDLAFPKGWEARHLGEAEKYGIFYNGNLKEQGFVTKEACLTRINAMLANDMQQNANKAANASLMSANAGMVGGKAPPKKKAEQAQAAADEAAA